MNKESERKKHILLISQYFYPETFRVNDMACEWVKRGYKVTVLTGIPNYPMGKYFDGYDRKHRRRELWNGVDIIRIPLIARGNSRNKFFNALGMASNYMSFVNSGRRWVKSKQARELRPDLVFTFEVSPMTQALIGVWYGKRYKVPTFLYVQDLWPENVETVTGIHNKLIIGPIDRMVDRIYKQVDHIFVTSPSFVNAVANRKVKVNPKKIHYWPQYAEDFYRPMEPQKVEAIDVNDDSYKIAFTGNIGKAQGLDILPQAAKLLKDENVKFVIVGDGRNQTEFEEQLDEHDVRDKFIMIPRVSPERVPEILSNVDAGFISFSKLTLWENTIPAKLQSYMACGKAIIASASGETERVITEAGCGVCSEIGNVEALAVEIRKMMRLRSKELGMRARSYFEDKFDKKTLMNEMDGYIERCISNRAHPKALVLASVASMIDQFNMPNIKLLQSGGYQVTVITDFSHPGNISEERSKELVTELNGMCVDTFDIGIPRSLNPSKIVNAYVKTKKIINDEKFDLIHCHSPIGGVIARLAAKRSRKTNGTRVIYTAHGFHFYDGAPLKNWVIFYPIEKWMSRYTDVLITINQQDYKRALLKFKTPENVYIPGIGIDTERFKNKNGDAIRKELGIEKDEVLLLSVGELNKNKNHEVIIKALGRLNEKPYYVIVGRGEKEEYYKKLIDELNLQDRVKLLGYRTDVADFYSAADVFVFPSFREGLSVSLMEAMASGMAVACSKIRGNVDLIDREGGFFFDPGDIETVIDALRRVLVADRQSLGGHNKEKIKNFDLKTVEKSISKVYGINYEV